MVPRRLILMTVIACGVLITERAGLAALDICGCIGNPKSVGTLDTVTRSGFPPGTVDTFRSITIPVPADGVIIANSVNFSLRPEEGCCLNIIFVANQANTPLTILSSGDVNIGPSVTLTLAGANGGNASFGGAGTGGIGGPGGFRGGDAAYFATNGATDGAAGLGPTGGAPGLANPSTRGGDGTFFGLRELLPLVGGAGGGGGASLGPQLNCGGGGGGGGGGAILIAANGTVTVNGAILADGGTNGFEATGCGGRGGAGSGGAIRIVASTITGSGFLGARGGFVDCCTRTGGPGIVRLESVNNILPAGNTDPPASRSSVPGPVTNPFSPAVRITTVAGQPVPVPATGGSGGVDVFIPAPGPTQIDVSTSSVPSGTTLEVTIKPRLGSNVVKLNAPLSNCDTAGNCIATVVPTLASGGYSIEARATFQVQ